MTDFATLLSIEVETAYEQCTETADKGIVHPGVEIQLLTKHAQLITKLEKEINDYPERICCSCVYIRESLQHRLNSLITFVWMCGLN